MRDPITSSAIAVPLFKPDIDGNPGDIGVWLCGACQDAGFNRNSEDSDDQNCGFRRECVALRPRVDLTAGIPPEMLPPTWCALSNQFSDRESPVHMILLLNSNL
jgi:hypothetical protein